MATLHSRLSIWIITIAAILAACGDNHDASGPTTIEVGPADLVLERGQTAELAADYRGGILPIDDADIQWTSSDPAVVEVDGAGARATIHAVATGAAEITAAGHGLTSSVTVTVRPASLQSIAITPPQPTLAAGTTSPIAVIATFSDNTTTDVTTQVAWTSSKPAIAAATGAVLSGLVRGEATITAALSGKFSTTRVTVTPELLLSIDVTPGAATVSLGAPQQFLAMGHFTDASVQDITNSVTWASSMTSVATISNVAGTRGRAAATGTGTTTITATLGTISGSTMLTVISAALVSFVITPNDPDVPLGADQPLTATGTFSDTSTADVTGMVTWSSSNQAVATISAGGVAVTLAVGSTTITGSIGALGDTTQLDVFLAPVGPWIAEPGFPAAVPCSDGVKFAMASDAVYVCSVAGGLLKGSVAGTAITWAAANTGVTNLAGLSLATHSQSPTTLMYMPVPQAGVANWFRSTDAAATSAPFTLNDSAGNPRFVYAGRFQSMIGNLLGTWDPGAGTPQAVVLTGMNPPTSVRVLGTATGTVRSLTGSAATNLYAGVFGETPSGTAATGGIFRSINSAVTWTAQDGGIAAADKNLVFSLAIDPVNALVLYAGLRGGGRLYKTTDGGASWSASATGIPARAKVTQVLVATPATTVFAATDIGLYRSLDAGATWALVGFQGRAVRGVAQSGLDPTLILAGVDDAVGLYRAM